MSGNSFGTLFKVTTFGESHGAGIGGVIDGCPSNIPFDEEFIKKELARRRPGQSHIVTQRKETEEFTVFSGVFEGKTTGTPIGFLIKNSDQKSKDYDHIKDVFRPSHADYTYQKKYGIRDHRGGGRSSARETAIRVFAGAVAKLWLREQKVNIEAYVSSVGDISIPENEVDMKERDKNVVRAPHKQKAKEMETFIQAIRKSGDTIGGMVSCKAEGIPVGLGEPIFNRLEAELAKAMLSINATKGFEIGSGFEGTRMKGSKHNDAFLSDPEDNVSFASNYSGGVQGGISNGAPITFRVAFKPVATIILPQTTINENHQTVEIIGKGRHDPCVVPRAVPIVEAMTALTLINFFLLYRAYK